MTRSREIEAAYETVGKLSNLYNSMMANSSLAGRLALKIFWGLSADDYRKFLTQAFAGVPKNFAGKLLEVPVGTGVISLPVYENLRDADIFCLDYSRAMLSAAENLARKMNLPNVKFLQGDVGDLPFPDENFDLVLSIDGLHAFPQKAAAYDEMWRVLKFGGTFCGCLYVTGQNWRTDLFVEKFCVRHGFFTPPFETLKTLGEKLGELYAEVQISNVQSFAGFICKK